MFSRLFRFAFLIEHGGRLKIGTVFFAVRILFENFEAQRMQARSLAMMEPAPFVIKFFLKVMKSAYRSVMFYIGQKELEMQYKMNRIVAQCRQKCEVVQEKFTEKLEQVHTAYQKMAKRCQMMEREMENISKDKQELQEKFAEKSRQKRKLDEMYDQLRNEHESLKRSAIQPVSNFYPRNEPDLFSNPVSLMDNREPMRKGPREEIWPTRQNSGNSGHFDISVGSPAKQAAPMAMEAGNRRGAAHNAFGSGAGNPSMTLRNLILSPIKRPQLSRRPQMFTL
ncbi:E3 ubiquitin-protein ligase CCNB1IP1-like protein, partial [Cucurbita argyrosperma subsp. sororia]